MSSDNFYIVHKKNWRTYEVFMGFASDEETTDADLVAEKSPHFRGKKKDAWDYAFNEYSEYGSGPCNCGCGA